MQLIAPPEATFQSDLPIRIEGAAPGERIAIACATTDALGQGWCARGEFVADALGTVDTGSTPSTGGTYSGTDIGGLFWSMRPATMRAGETRAAYCERALEDRTLPLTPELAPLGAVTYEVTASSSDGQAQTTTRVVRRRVAGNVEARPVSAGDLQGIAFRHTDGARRPGVLVLGGSEGGLLPARAAALAAEGFVTLALGYFDYKERPKAAIDLPLEYFGEALQWLRRDCTASAVFGASRGSEAALLSACHFPELVDAVVAWVPSNLVNTGFDMASGQHFSNETRAMWALGGRSIPGVGLPAADENKQAERTGGMGRFPGYAFAPEFLAAWRAQPPTSELAIPLDKLEAPLFAAGGRDDRLWPSAYAVEQIKARLETVKFDKALVGNVYPDAGHMIGVPNEIRPFSDVVHWADGYSGVDSGLVHYGGTPPGNAAAARRSWQDVVQFLNAVLGNDAAR